MNNERAQQIIADHKLVKAIVGNLGCCSVRDANGALEALSYRWNERAGEVSRDYLEKILDWLPTLSEGINHEDGPAVYRAGSDVIAKCLRLLNHSKCSAIEGARIYQES